MLVLSRKRDEQIVIIAGDQQIKVRVVSIDGNKVRLGVDAPKQIEVHRQEVWQRRAEFVDNDEPLIVGDARVAAQKHG